MTSSASAPAIAASVAVELEVAARAGRVDGHRAELAVTEARQQPPLAQAIESTISSFAWRSALTSLSSGTASAASPSVHELASQTIGSSPSSVQRHSASTVWLAIRRAPRS